MSKLPIVEALLKYSKESNSYFATPGHKMGRAFYNIKEGKEILDNFIDLDITEVDGVDNLHNPSGVIQEAQEYLSDYYSSEKSYFLVNGSTSGNLAMIFASFDEGDKIIVERNCHRSVYNGIILRKLRPIYIKNRISDKFNTSLSIDEDYLFNLIEENKDAKGIIITYPNYYGICCDLKKIVLKAKEHNMKVLVDCAHGAHFGVIEELPENPMKLGVDMAVQSAHKTLPSLTQTAYLHIGNKDDIDKANFYVSMFLSTSPSYLFLATMDFSRYFMEKYGQRYYTELLALCQEFKQKINRLGVYHIIGEKDLIDENIYDIDKTRYVINLPKGFSGHKLLSYLKEESIQCEMSDERNVVLIFSPGNSRSDFELLYKALEKCDINKLKAKIVKVIESNIPQMKMMPYEVIDRKKKKVKIIQGVNEICGHAIVPYPPGIPLVMPGEFITKEITDIIQYYIDINVTLLGVEDNELTIVKE